MVVVVVVKVEMVVEGNKIVVEEKKEEGNKIVEEEIEAVMRKRGYC